MEHNNLLDDKEQNDDDKKPSYKEIIGWWESRRLAYNFMVCGSSCFFLLISLGVFIFLIFTVGHYLIFYIVAINILYTFTWVFELLLFSIFHRTIEENVRKTLYTFLIVVSILLPFLYY